jgi:hypothetical protein
MTFGARAHGLLNDYTWFSRRSAAEECPDGLLAGCERTLVGIGKSGGADLRILLDEPSWHASTMLGVDSRLRHARSELTVRDRATGAVAPFNNDYTRTDALIAPYLQQSFAPYRWLDANLGARLDYDTRFGHKLSPRAALGVSPWHSGRIKAIYSEAFRGPTAYELNYADPVEQVAAPGLSAETVRSLELSFEQRVGPHRLFFGVFRSAWTGLVSFRTLNDDEVVRAVAAGTLEPTTELAYSYANAGKIENYGYNAAYEGRIGRKLRLAGNLTSAYGWPGILWQRPSQLRHGGQLAHPGARAPLLGRPPRRPRVRRRLCARSLRSGRPAASPDLERHRARRARAALSFELDVRRRQPRRLRGRSHAVRGRR